MGSVSEAEILGPDGEVDPTAVARVIDEVADRADRTDETSPPPDETVIQRELQAGLGRAVGLYILLRTGDRHYPFSAEEYERLEGAMQTFLERYARWYGTDIESSATLRAAAKTLLETNDLRETAAMLTGVTDPEG